MHLSLHKLCIGLQTNEPLIKQQWQSLFGDWLSTEVTPRDITLQLELVEHLPPLPQNPPFFSDTHHLPDNIGILSVYHTKDQTVLLHYLDGAIVCVPLATTSQPKAAGVLLPIVMQYGRFEDVTFTSLAPLLRRRGYFLVHAFAACKNGRAVLIVGPSGSGKTTTGLKLLLDGWQLLSNDILLIEERPDGVYALPMPGGVSIREASLNVLTELPKLIGNTPLINGQYELAANQLTNGRWPNPTHISAIYFPQFNDINIETAVYPTSKIIALTRLMEESMDRWDEPAFAEHMAILQKMCQQAAVYNLYLSPDLSQLSQLLDN